MLLRRGAVCDRDKFEGARCIYGALTDSIRNILLNYDISKAVDTKQPFASHLSSQLVDTSINSHDIVFELADSTVIKAHRFLLSARSPYFEHKFSGPWQNRPKVYMSRSVSARALDLIFKYIYLVPVLHEVSQAEGRLLIQFCKKLGFSELQEYITASRQVEQSSGIARTINDYQFRISDRGRQQMRAFVNKIIDERIQVGLEDCISSHVLQNLKMATVIPDVFILVTYDHDAQCQWLFPCHRSFLIRSEYYRVMFTSSFSEAASYYQLPEGIVDRSRDFPVVALPCKSLAVAKLVLSFLYYDETEVPWQLALETLKTADAILSDRLKTMAAVSIIQSPELLHHHSIYEVLNVAWDTRMERLEDYAAQVFAQQLGFYCEEELFKQAVLRSSQRIRKREETDTIELVDDIRYHLLKRYKVDTDDLNMMDTGAAEYDITMSKLAPYEDDLQKLEKVLQELGLNA